MTEQEATDKLEELVGSIDGCFRLMRLYQQCESTVSGQRFDFSLRKKPTVDELFQRRAQMEGGYTAAAILHYLNHVR